jgi:hypothetical protein
MVRLAFAMLLSSALVGSALAKPPPLYPPGFHPVAAEARFEVAAYSIAAPGKGWIQGPGPNAVVLVKRIDATESYHAGLKVAKVEQLPDRDAFLRAMEKAATAQSGNPRFQNVRLATKERALAGFWAAQAEAVFDDTAAVNAGRNEALLTRGRTWFIMDPKEPDVLATLWFSWRGTKKDEARFNTEAEAFFATLGTPKPKN